MKKFLALAFAGAMALTVTACGAKEDVKEAVKEVNEEVKDVKEEAEEKVEEVVELAEESEFDYEQGGIGMNLPEGWTAEEGSDSSIIKVNDNKGNTGILIISSDEGEAEEDFRLFGLGKGSTKNGTEAENIDAFEAGNFAWRGYSFVYPAIWYDAHILNLVSEPDEDGKYMEVQAWLGENGAEDFAIDDENLGYIMGSLDFVE